MQFWVALVFTLALLPLTIISTNRIPEFPRSPLQRVITKIAKSLLVSAAVLPPQIAFPDILNTADVLSIKMERLPEGLLAINFTVDAMQGPFRAIVDTGSPFLLVPSICTSEWGCENPSALAAIADPFMLFKIAELSPTVESFGGQEYDVEWKRGDIKFIGSKAIEPMSSRTTFRNIVFGSVGEDITRRPGGVFCGLIRRRAQEIRPTLLGQLGYDSFAFDAAKEVLTLSCRPLIAPTEDAIKIVDLRTYGSPIQHYAARVKYLYINGQRIIHGTNLFCIIDTGTTGCVLSDDITFNENTPSPVRSVRVVLQTEHGGEVILEAGASTRTTKSPPFVVSTAFVPWPGFRRAGQSKKYPYIGASRAFLPGPSLVVIGLPFLQLGRSSLLTVDTESGRMRVS
jgi:hypothetical protein